MAANASLVVATVLIATADTSANSARLTNMFRKNLINGGTVTEQVHSTTMTFAFGEYFFTNFTTTYACNYSDF